MNPSRAEWRDAVKEAESLTTNATFVALLVADYWSEKRADATVWCAVSTLTRQSRLSRASVFKFLGELRAKGWLLQVEAGTPTKSPRYRPLIPPSVVQTPSARRTRKKGSVLQTGGVCTTDGGICPTDPKPQTHHSPPHEPSHENGSEVEGHGSWDWQRCPSCRSVGPCDCNLLG